MNTFLAIVLSNVVVALLLAMIVAGVTRFWRSPQLAHALWALVLLKLITPPVAFVSVPQGWLGASVDTDSPRAESSAVDDAEIFVAGPPRSSADGIAPRVSGVSMDSIDPEAARAAENVASSIDHGDAESGVPDSAVADSAAAPIEPMVWRRAVESIVLYWQPVCGIIWCVGAGIYALVLLRRSVRFRRVLASAHDAPAEASDSAARLSERLGLKHCPPLRVVDAPIPPLVWSIGLNPMIVLPARLLDSLDNPERDAVIAHELAHVYRRDDLMRWLELVVLIAFWWNPIAWLARCRLREAEEECCDAWVVWALPHERRQYGQAMLKTIEFLTERPLLPVLAGSAFGTSFYKRRIEMVMKHNVRRTASWQAKLAMLVLTLTVLPLAATAMSQDDADAPDRVAPGSEDDIRRDEEAGNRRSPEATWANRTRSDAAAQMWQQFYFRGNPPDTKETANKWQEWFKASANATPKAIEGMASANNLHLLEVTKVPQLSDLPAGPIQEAAGKLEPGQISPPIRTDDGFVLLLAPRPRQGDSQETFGSSRGSSRPVRPDAARSSRDRAPNEWRVLQLKTPVSSAFVNELVAKFPDISVNYEGNWLLVFASKEHFAEIEQFVNASGIPGGFAQFPQPLGPGTQFPGSDFGSRFPRHEADDLTSVSQKDQEALQERIDVLQEIRRLQENAYKKGEATLDAVLRAKMDLAEAQLELAATVQQREKAWNELVAYARQLEAMIQKQLEAGKASQVDVLKAKSFRLRLEAESLNRGSTGSNRRSAFPGGGAEIPTRGAAFPGQGEDGSAATIRGYGDTRGYGVDDTRTRTQNQPTPYEAGSRRNWPSSRGEMDEEGTGRAPGGMDKEIRGASDYRVGSERRKVAFQIERRLLQLDRDEARLRLRAAQEKLDLTENSLKLLQQQIADGEKDERVSIMAEGMARSVSELRIQEELAKIELSRAEARLEMATEASNTVSEGDHPDR